MKEARLRSIIREELITEVVRKDSSTFANLLGEVMDHTYMGYRVEPTTMDTIRFFTTENGQRIHVHAIPFFEGRTEDMTASIAINDETVRQGLVAFYGGSMVQEIKDGNFDAAVEMYKDGVSPLLEAGYGLAKIRT